jgi:ammonium transporter, Amt family
MSEDLDRDPPPAKKRFFGATRVGTPSEVGDERSHRRRGVLAMVEDETVDVVFTLYCATLVFSMQIGFTLLEVGSVSIRNTKNILLKNLLDLCVTSVVFYLFGYGLSNGESEHGFAGRDGFALTSSMFSSSVVETSARAHAHAFFSFAFAATSATIVSGAVAERFPFQSYAIMSAAMAGVIFPVVAHWPWATTGWANPAREGGSAVFDVGALDYAGGGVVHMVGGLAALWSVYMVGPRIGRFEHGRNNSQSSMPQQSPVFQIAGGLFMWYGWYGFNCGSVRTLANDHLIIVSRIAIITTLCAAMGGATTVAVDWYRDKTAIRPVRMINGVLTGLVASSAPCAYVAIPNALTIGALSGLVYVWISDLMVKYRLDDVVDAVAIHLGGGALGLFGSALLSTQANLHQFFGDDYNACGLFYGCKNGGNVFAAMIVYMLAIIGWVSACVLIVLFTLQRFDMLRVSQELESHGLDKSVHGGQSYTEFQTTIFKFKDKSGGEGSMEMRVRAGDAAKFAMVLSEIMDSDISHSGGRTPAPPPSGAPRSPMANLGPPRLTTHEE